jgi:uncharacterized protein
MGGFMKLSIQEIRNSKVIDAAVLLPADEFFADDPTGPALVNPVATTFHAEAFSEEVMARGTYSTKIRMNCSRCLEDYEFSVSSSFEVHAPFNQGTLDITDEVRQSLLLALPLKPLCRENCAGICQHCGKNMNQEPCICSSELVYNPFEKLKTRWIH